MKFNEEKLPGSVVADQKESLLGKVRTDMAEAGRIKDEILGQQLKDMGVAFYRMVSLVNGDHDKHAAKKLAAKLKELARKVERKDALWNQ